MLAPAWESVAGGCHLNRETDEIFRTDERFELVDYTQLRTVSQVIRWSAGHSNAAERSQFSRVSCDSHLELRFRRTAPHPPLMYLRTVTTAESDELEGGYQIES